MLAVLNESAQLIFQIFFGSNVFYDIYSAYMLPIAFSKNPGSSQKSNSPGNSEIQMGKIQAEMKLGRIVGGHTPNPL